MPWCEISGSGMECLRAGSKGELDEDGNNHSVPYRGEFLQQFSNYQLLIILPRGVN